MISAAGIKDQDLTIIVSMMLIELALSRLSRAAFFKRLALLDTQGLELLVALLPRVWWARRAGTISLGKRSPSFFLPGHFAEAAPSGLWDELPACSGSIHPEGLRQGVSRVPHASLPIKPEYRRQ
jgi:hypothetical protein